jgi:hypothetical protein
MLEILQTAKNGVPYQALDSNVRRHVEGAVPMKTTISRIVEFPRL